MVLLGTYSQMASRGTTDERWVRSGAADAVTGYARQVPFAMDRRSPRTAS